ncbi:MAG: S8 family serine peptidase [Steroidobacteraceae bacterium]
MTTDADAELAFEAAAASDDILRHFDPAIAEFSFSKASPFWYGVELAHEEGRKGRGRRIAVVDSAFDLSRGRLRKQSGGHCRLATAPGESAQHGTAVALLVSEVAPEARLALYEVSASGRPRLQSVATALAMAADSDADIINLSLAHPVAGPVAEHRCAVQAGVSEAVRRGKIVIVAVGNYADTYVCPAQVPGLIAVGYGGEQRIVLPTQDAYHEVAAWRAPTYSQSLDPTFTIAQPPGVLGSSFAAPLASGLAALAVDPGELREFKASLALGANQAKSSAETVQLADKYYRQACEHLPRHEAEPDVRCPACAVLTQWILANAGRFYLNLRRTDVAESRLRRALWLAPWSADALANMGRLVEYQAELLFAAGERGAQVQTLLDDATHLYQAALRMRPGHVVYTAEVDKIAALRARTAPAV